jgi:multidrug efflux pump subunit AcrA (membrane-fusion protein)
MGASPAARMADPRWRRSRSRSRSRSRPLLAGAAVLVFSALVAGGAWAASGSAGPSYRVAVVARGPVVQTLDVVGTIEPVNEATASFPIAGTVSTLDVTVGQHVTAGQRLASLDTTTLDQQLSTAQAATATAALTLADDQNSQSAGSGTGTPSATPTPAASASAGRSTATAKPATAAGTAAVTSAQAAVRAAQQRIDQQLEQARADLDAQTRTCQAVLAPPGGPTPTPSGTPSVTPATRPTSPPSGTSAPTPPSSPAATPTPSPAPLGQPADPAALAMTAHLESVAAPARPATGQADDSACAQSLSTVLTDEAAIAASETTQSHDEATLDSAISALAGSAAPTTGPPASTGPTAAATKSGGAASATAATPGASSQRSTKGPATAAQIAADQAAADADAAEVALAEQNLAEAQLLAPIDGTVASASVSPGMSVSASSSTPAFIIIGAGTAEVTTSVNVTQIDDVKTGDTVQVTPDGAATPLPGTVTAVGLLSSTTGSTTTYPVTIGLAPSAEHLFAGAGATVSITIRQASDALTVPTSAVRTVDGISTVTVLDKGKAATARIATGVTGSALTQVLTGVTAGDRVVLADLTLPLPSSNSTAATRRLTGGGGVGAAGGVSGAGNGGLPGQVPGNTGGRGTSGGGGRGG